MNLDEQFLKKIRNTRLIEQVNENVIPINLKQKFKKGQFLLPFFLIVLNICDELNFS